MVDISNIVAGTVGEFVEYAMWVVGALTAYYVFRLFTIGSAEREGRREERRDRNREQRDRARERIQERRNAARRKRLLDPARGFIIRTEQAAEELRDNELRTQTAASVNAARRRVDTIRTNLRSSLRRISHARSNLRGEGLQEQREFLQRLYEANEVIIRTLRDDVENNLPVYTWGVPRWTPAVQRVRNGAGTITGLCGDLLNRIDTFIDDGGMPGEGRRGPRPRNPPRDPY